MSVLSVIIHHSSPPTVHWLGVFFPQIRRFAVPPDAQKGGRLSAAKAVEKTNQMRLKEKIY